MQSLHLALIALRMLGRVDAAFTGEPLPLAPHATTGAPCTPSARPRALSAEASNDSCYFSGPIRGPALRFRQIVAISGQCELCAREI